MACNKQYASKDSDPLFTKKSSIEKDTKNLDIEKLKNKLKAQPQNHELFYKLALKYYEIGDYTRTIFTLDKALELSPNDPFYHHDRGASFMQLTYYDSAIAEFKKTIALDSNFKEAYFNLYQSYIKSKNIKKAGKYLEAYVQKDTASIRGWLELGKYNREFKNKSGYKAFKKAADLGSKDGKKLAEKFKPSTQK